MKQINQKFLTGERALFQGKDLKIYDTTFADGESPLKESRNIELYRSMFKWKYPLWYSHNIKMEDCVLFEMGRAGEYLHEKLYCGGSKKFPPYHRNRTGARYHAECR